MSMPTDWKALAETKTVFLCSSFQTGVAFLKNACGHDVIEVNDSTHYLARYYRVIEH